MSEEQKQVSAVSKKQKKVLEQYADTKDPFVNALYKRLRNAQKKITKIDEVDTKIKAKEIQPTQEQIEMVQRKPAIKAEMDEVLGYLNIYKESFPDNPAFTAAGKKKKAEAEPAKVEVVAAPVVDVGKVVEDALSLVADATILGNLSARGTALTGSNNNINDALVHLHNAWHNLTHGNGSWESGKSNFVDTFSRLVNKSATQVAHSSKSFSDLNSFVATLSAAEGQTLFAQERSHSTHHHEHKHHDHKHAHKEESKPAEEKQVAADEPVHSAHVHAEPSSEVAEGSSPAVEGEETKGEHNDSPADQHHHKDGHRGGRGGRGGFRGNKNFYFKKHNTDEEGFTVVKDEDNHHHHYPSKRHQNATRGGFRGGRGGNQQKEGEGQRGGRGGRGGRPWTAKEHRNQGEVRKTDTEQPADDNGPKSEAQ